MASEWVSRRQRPGPCLMQQQQQQCEGSEILLRMLASDMTTMTYVFVVK